MMTPQPEGALNTGYIHDQGQIPFRDQFLIIHMKGAITSQGEIINENLATATIERYDDEEQFRSRITLLAADDESRNQYASFYCKPYAPNAPRVYPLPKGDSE